MQKRAVGTLVQLVRRIRARRNVGVDAFGEELESHSFLEAITSEVGGNDCNVDVTLVISVPASVGSKQEGPGNSDVVLPNRLHVASYESLNCFSSHTIISRVSSNNRYVIYLDGAADPSGLASAMIC